VEIVLNPLGVPSRMNGGAEILETHLGWAAAASGAEDVRALVTLNVGAEAVREAVKKEFAGTATQRGQLLELERRGCCCVSLPEWSRARHLALAQPYSMAPGERRNHRSCWLRLDVGRFLQERRRSFDGMTGRTSLSSRYGGLHLHAQAIRTWWDDKIPRAFHRAVLAYHSAAAGRQGPQFGGQRFGGERTSSEGTGKSYGAASHPSGAASLPSPMTCMAVRKIYGGPLSR